MAEPRALGRIVHLSFGEVSGQEYVTQLTADLAIRLRGREAIVNQPSRLYHVCYRTQDGFAVVDVWADEQSFAAFGQTLGPAVRNAGLDAGPAVYPVEQIMTQDGTRSS